MNTSVRNSLESIFINKRKSNNNNNNDHKKEEIHFAFIQRNNLSRNLLPKVIFFEERALIVLHIYLMKSRQPCSTFMSQIFLINCARIKSICQ